LAVTTGLGLAWGWLMQRKARKSILQLIIVISGVCHPRAVPLEVVSIPVRTDNYVFVLHNGVEAAVVDPAEDGPIREWLLSRGLSLTSILQTHHHSDHIGGTPGLLRTWPGAQVVAAAADRERIPFQTHGVRQGDGFTLLGRQVRVLEVPGHTRAHVAYVLPALAPDQRDELFCGDTLFAGGCGRLFEGTADQMHESLQQLMALPENTRVWCAHEYTEANLRWAATQAPEDAAIARRLEEVCALRRAGLPTIPSTLGLERRTNLFVQASDARELARLRSNKDGWRG
jgi:hydroxyacylglutathione hydrolase